MQLEGHSGAVTDVVFGPDRTSLYTGCEDKNIKVWDFRTGKCIQTMTCATPVSAVSFARKSPTTRLRRSRPWARSANLVHVCLYPPR